MKIGYLTNQYPKISHSFIRREIKGVELAGHEVVRYAVRAVNEPLVDARDQAEARQTRVLLSASAVRRLLGAGLRMAATSPLAFARSMAAAWHLGRRSDRGLVVHLAYLLEACVLRYWCRRDGVQHLHAHFATNPPALALLCHLLGGPPYSFTAHGTEAFDHPRFIGMQRKVAAARFAVAVSHFGRSQMMRWSDPDHWHKIHVIRCGVDPDFLETPAEPVPDVERFVCVARFSPEKGIACLLDAQARLRADGVIAELVLVGDGEDEPALRKRVAELGLTGSVTFRGWLDSDALRRVILDSRFLVLPSFGEGVPLVLMEAMALRRPVIATRVGGIGELVEPGHNGWLIAPGDVTSLTAALVKALRTSVAQLTLMGERGRAAVLDRHDAHRCAAELAALISAAD